MVFQLSIPNNAIHSFNCVKQLDETRRNSFFSDDCAEVESICSLILVFMMQESLPTDLGQMASMASVMESEVDRFQKDEQFVEQCICAVTYMYMECVRNEVNPFDFEEVSRIAGWGSARISILKQTYEQIVPSLFLRFPL